VDGAQNNPLLDLAPLFWSLVGLMVNVFGLHIGLDKVETKLT
jgi:hypothetical protein